MNIRRILREELYKQSNIDYIIKKKLHEGFNRLILNESQESKSQSKAIKLAMQNGMDRERAEQFVRVDLRNDLSELRHSDTAKFTLGCTRLYFERQLTDAKSISLLNQILGLITKKYYDKFDQNLNGVSMTELSEQFSQELEDIEVQNRNDVNGKQYANQGYKIVPIYSFGEAQEYYDDCYPDSPWCITHMDDMWKNYTKEGENQVYFCLKNGFSKMDVPEEETGNFKDEYGLSMISVIVDKNGKLQYSTTRWNHANGASGDHDLSVQEISDIVGVNFYQTFKPLSIEDKLNYIENKLKSGVSPYNLFDDISNYIDGIASVRINDKYNFIDKNGNILSKQLFDYAWDFNKNVAKVELDNKYNFINKEGILISNIWFDLAQEFNDGIVSVELHDSYNFLNIEGNLLSNQWFDYSLPFKHGTAYIEINNNGNYIDKEANILFDYASSPDSTFGLSIVKLNNKENFFTYKSKLLSDTWFDEVSAFYDDVSIVKLNNKYNMINLEGNLIFDDWYDKVGEFNDKGVLRAVKINKNGERDVFLLNRDGNVVKQFQL